MIAVPKQSSAPAMLERIKKYAFNPSDVQTRVAIVDYYEDAADISSSQFQRWLTTLTQHVPDAVMRFFDECVTVLTQALHCCEQHFVDLRPVVRLAMLVVLRCRQRLLFSGSLQREAAERLCLYLLTDRCCALQVFAVIASVASSAWSQFDRIVCTAQVCHRWNTAEPSALVFGE